MILPLQSLATVAALLSLLLAPLGAAADGLNIQPDTPVASLIASAKAARARGSNNDALAYFDAAVSRDPSDYLTLFQRGATLLSLGRNAQASNDFDAVLKLRPGFEGALLQRGKIKARTADWAAAREDYRAAGEKAVDELVTLQEAEGAQLLAIEAEKAEDWEACIHQAGIAIMTAGAALSLRQLRSRCRLERGEVQEALSDLHHVLNIRSGLVEPHLQISAMQFYSLGDAENALKQVKACLHSDPESKTCKKLFREEKDLVKQLDKLNAHLASKQYSSASKLLVGLGTEDEPGLLHDVQANIDAHRAAGTIHPKAPADLHTNLLEKTCECYMSMSNMKKAALYCPTVLTLRPDSLHALLHQAQTHLDAENFEAAINSLTTARDAHPEAQGTVNQKLHEAQVLLKRSKTKDYYKVLDVPRDADERTIKRAYRTASKQFHPDKAASKGVSKEEAEKKMAAINEAYEVLSDPELRARFDRGDDPNDPMSQQGGNPFQGSPFGGGGGQQFFFQQGFPQGGGGQRFKFSQGGGNPFGGFPGF